MTYRVEPFIVRFPEVDSTNRKARELAEGGAREGTVVIAERQTAGRGSQHRDWASPQGGLYLSALLLPNQKNRAPELSVLAGLALTQAVRDLLPKSIDVTVKWPNDCLANLKKIGGVLCEMLGPEGGKYCVVGIGLNVNLSSEALKPFENNPFSATSFAIENPGPEFSVSKAAEVLINKLFNLYHHYQDSGFEAIRYLWEKNCSFVGKRVELRGTGWESEKDSQSTVGTFQGIDDSGGLVLLNARGERRSYATGEITCFWQ